jgi:hypothetical protein
MTNLRNGGVDKAEGVYSPTHSPTFVEILRYLVEKHRTWSRLAELVEVAQWIEAERQTGHNGSDTALGFRRSLFRAEIKEAERLLEGWRGFDMDGYEDIESDRLAKAIANYLDLPPTKSWSVDSLIEVIGRLER